MGKTIVMVTHDGHAVQSARHVTHLEKGELIESVIPAEAGIQANRVRQEAGFPPSRE